MKSKTFQNGKFHGRSYLKSVGKGWECGFTLKGKPVFVGNFIHFKEANHWYQMMNREVFSFSKKFGLTGTFPVLWYSHFCSNHLYKCYYAFLDKVFTKYNRDFHKAYNYDVKKYHHFKKKESHKAAHYARAA